MPKAQVFVITQKENGSVILYYGEYVCSERNLTKAFTIQKPSYEWLSFVNLLCGYILYTMNRDAIALASSPVRISVISSGTGSSSECCTGVVSCLIGIVFRHTQDWLLQAYFHRLQVLSSLY